MTGDAWEAIEARSVRECIPLRGVIELLYACQFRCGFCYLDRKRDDPVRLDRTQCRTIFGRLRRAGTLVLSFTGGEPFLHPDLAGILADARAGHFAVRLFTNGALIDDAAAAMLAGIQPLLVDLSLYGATPAVYGRVTGAAVHFQAVMHGLDLLARHRVSTVVKIVIHRDNAEELPAMEALARARGFSTVVTPLLTPTDCGDRSPCGLMLDDAGLRDFFRDRPAAPVRRGTEEILCTSGRNGFVIAPNGDVLPCIQVRRPVGNILAEEMTAIWNGVPHPDLAAIRALRFKDMAVCTGCADAPHCFICPGLAGMASGRITGIDPAVCRITRAVRGA
ncbi:MAG: radical SAM protein [Planctomycetota bacterium]